MYAHIRLPSPPTKHAYIYTHTQTRTQQTWKNGDTDNTNPTTKPGYAATAARTTIHECNSDKLNKFQIKFQSQKKSETTTTKPKQHQQ